MLIKKFANCSQDVKAKLFKSYCCSIYCGALWSSYTVETYKKLQTSYNNVIRHLFKLDIATSISAKCIELNIDCFKVLLRKQIFSLRNRVLICDNLLVRAILSSTFFYTSSVVSKWNDLLFMFSTS